MERVGISTVVTLVTELFPGNGSGPLREMTVRLVRAAGAWGAAITIFIVATLFAAKVPTLQLILPPARTHAPCDVVTAINEAAAGRKLVNVTPAAAEGPVL